MLCNTIIQPHFDYASSTWYPNLGKGLNDKLQIAQRNIFVTVFTWTIKEVLDTNILEPVLRVHKDRHDSKGVQS